MHEIKRDIFEFIDEELEDKDTLVVLMHCVSSDFALGAGIAKAIDKKYHEKKFLRDHKVENTWNGHGWAYLSNHKPDLGKNLCICNLVTKEKYFNKPSYTSLDEALKSSDWLIDTAFSWSKAKNLKIVMPRIGCGLDRLQWYRVKEMISQWAGLKYTDITVCYLED